MTSPRHTEGATEAERIEPVVTLGYHQSEDGTYRAVMTVSGLATEQRASAALDHMQKLFCGNEMEARND